jgi:hypothetical protein
VKGYIIKLLVRIAPFDFLVASVLEMGWDIAVPKGEGGDAVPGLVVGNDEYIEKILDALEKAEWGMIDNDSN